MREIFEKLTKVVEADGDEFSNDTELTLYIDGLEAGEESHVPDKINLTYSISTEWRSWGLKDISVIPKGRVEFEAEIVDVDDNVIDTITINIDLDDAKLVWVSGSGYVPESLEVRVDRTGKLVEVDLNFYFQDHS